MMIANAISSLRSTRAHAFLIACFPSLVRAIRRRRSYRRSFVFIALVVV
jgi:hypothetical protein